MKQGLKRRGMAVVAAAALGLMSANSVFGAVIAGPLQDAKEASAGLSVTISIHSQFWKVTDDITIIWRAANAFMAGVGYAETIAGDPDNYRLTTIYGDDLNPAGPALLVGGVNATTPDYDIVGGEHIHGTNGLIYDSSSSASLTFQQLSAQYPQFDLSVFDGTNTTAVFRQFTTIVPVSAVPEPASLAIGLGGIGFFALRRRRSS